MGSFISRSSSRTGPEPSSDLPDQDELARESPSGTTPCSLEAQASDKIQEDGGRCYHHLPQKMRSRVRAPWGRRLVRWASDKLQEDGGGCDHHLPQKTPLLRKEWGSSGIPNTTEKYREDHKVLWHHTPFEERLLKALSAERQCRQRSPALIEGLQEADTRVKSFALSTVRKC
ncbi:hypothetical protein EJB05_06057 [Eragrostis curvula]|uniref:Uncharacterized protein n=1 Tax=Eragrostis curvula TaxID=38414 RepID=A0A5J9WEY1_9POAL|nr:hypothetical protein EJB05_06057 [Eragrostis curvula]